MNPFATRGIFDALSDANALRTGVGLKPAHFTDIFARKPDIGFFEIHAENYMGEGGPARRALGEIRRDYPLSVHGVCLSLGSSGPLDRAHLARLAEVVRRYEPFVVSEHLAWSSHGEIAFPDLLPIAYDDEALAQVVAHIDETQSALGRRILVENPATYLRFAGDAMSETDFLREVLSRTGCGLLLDVNNVFVSSVNHGFDAREYIDALPLDRVGEIHLAGFAEARDADGIFLIDDHGSQVGAEVWALYRHMLDRAGPRPTLIEWDNRLPPWRELHAEAQKAGEILRAAAGERAGESV